MKIGILTYHRANNYGAMLQAYALRQVMLHYSQDVSFVAYNPQYIKEDYATVVHRKSFASCGKRKKLRYPIYLMHYCYLRIKEWMRNRAFETFASKYLPEGRLDAKYDLVVYGSDQIWSNRIPELVGSETDYSGVYFLDFVSPSKKKISFASSTGAATIEDLIPKVDLLKQYDYISTREVTGADIISELIDREVTTVIDPTLMLTGDDWRKIIHKKRVEKEKYIFLYTLKGIRPGRKWGDALKQLGKELGLKVVCVSPFFPIVHSGVKNYINVGPEDFLNLIENAELVFTDSFHGTAFSVNLEKPFYTLSLENDSRKADLLKELGLDGRIINSFADIDLIGDYNIDFSVARERLKVLRNEGYKFLKDAIEG